MQAASASRPDDARFAEVLASALGTWERQHGDDGVFTMALPLQGVDPLQQLPLLQAPHPFRFLWDGAPGLSLAASGRCHHLDLAGPKRFELAQRFSDATLARLIDASPSAPAQARSRVLLAFTFFAHPGEQQPQRWGEQPDPADAIPAVQAVLPRWQLSRHGRQGWLRIQGFAQHSGDVRELVEALWTMRDRLLNPSPHHDSTAVPWHGPVGAVSNDKPWQQCYAPAFEQGIALVNSGELHKVVLAVRQSIALREPLHPLPLLDRLRQQQAGSCRFLWQRSHDDAFFGASPERLLSLRGGQLRSDALAGTAGLGDCGDALLQSDKDRREHELVVQAITEHLQQQGLSPRRPRRPQLARHGQLVHLHTPITAATNGLAPLTLAGALHPTPAVAGLPQREAMTWLRNLEPFERGGYAAPVGWIDSAGDTELRVAIRCGHARGHRLELTAGAGLVRGSLAERELQEVGLKLAVLADQLDLQSSDRSQAQRHA
ncbi:MAG: isochorismate synthase [Synechococcus sp.]